MHHKFEEFLKALRGANIPVSLAEGIDAFDTLSTVGYADRQILKDALAAAIAKSPEHKQIFDDCFELFFDRDTIPPLPQRLSNPEDGAAEDGEDGETIDGGNPGDAMLSELLQAGDGNAIAQQMELAGNAVGVSNIRYATQRGFFSRRMLDQMGLNELEQQIADLNNSEQPSDRALAEQLEEGRQFLLDEAQRYVARQQAIYAAPAAERLREEFLLDTRFGNIDPRDSKRMYRLVRQLAKRMAVKHTRRRKRKERGQLDMRRTISANVSNDNVPFETFWKERKIDRPKVVAVCDVSRSVASAVEFLLLFLYSLNEVVTEIRTFAFSDSLTDVGDILEREDMETAVKKILEKIGFRSTDYGQALRDLRENYETVIDRRTTIIILGDGRSNHTDPEIEILSKLSHRAKQIVWLNPEPVSFWGTGDSEMDRYRHYCRLSRTCNNLKHLERAIDDMLKSYER